MHDPCTASPVTLVERRSARSALTHTLVRASVCREMRVSSRRRRGSACRLLHARSVATREREVNDAVDGPSEIAASWVQLHPNIVYYRCRTVPERRLPMIASYNTYTCVAALVRTLHIQSVRYAAGTSSTLPVRSDQTVV